MTKLRAGDGQLWIVTQNADLSWRIPQKSSGRYLDA
jgi:hypothetical protein